MTKERDLKEKDLRNISGGSGSISDTKEDEPSKPGGGSGGGFNAPQSGD